MPIDPNKLYGGAQAKIGPKPKPSGARRALEILTGYPADPSREMDPLDLLGMLPGASAAGKGLKIGYKAAAEKYRPIIQELNKIIASPNLPDPQRVALFQRVTPQRIPHRAAIEVPEGFELPASASPFISRDPALSERYLQQRAYQVMSGGERTAAAKSKLNLAKAGSEEPSVGAQINREMRLGIRSPAIRNLEELEIAKSAAKEIPQASVIERKPIIQASGALANRRATASRARAKLTDDQVRAVRASSESNEALGRKYGVTGATIGDIRRHLTYTWVKK